MIFFNHFYILTVDYAIVESNGRVRTELSLKSPQKNKKAWSSRYMGIKIVSVWVIYEEKQKGDGN